MSKMKYAFCQCLLIEFHSKYIFCEKQLLLLVFVILVTNYSNMYKGTYIVSVHDLTENVRSNQVCLMTHYIIDTQHVQSEGGRSGGGGGMGVAVVWPDEDYFFGYFLVSVS